MTKELSTNSFAITVFGTDDASFNVTATVLEKGKDAYLVDAGFAKATALEIVSFLKEKGLVLKGAFVLHGDPDYYFGMEQVLRAFPEVEILSTAETQQHIAETVVGKLAVWNSALGDEAPANVVLPKAISRTTLDILGTEFKLVGDDPARANLFQKDESLLIGGIDTFNELHLFLADTGSEEQLGTWASRVSSLEALGASLVIPSHADLKGSFDSKALSATKDYLETAIELAQSASRSEELAASLRAAYPSYINTGVVDLGAKVLTGEIQWG